MSNIEGQQAYRVVVGPVTRAQILGLDTKHPEPPKPLGDSKARILAESAGGNIDPRFVGLGTNMTVRRRFA
jgi:hypothetical protein